MQSLKNTGVTVMLLFLSYGVYQVIMKPMPEKDSSRSIELLSISDPQIGQSRSQATEPLKLDFGNPTASTATTFKTPELPHLQPPRMTESIPKQLLDLPEKIEQQISQNDFLDQGGLKLNELKSPPQQNYPIDQPAKTDFVAQANNIATQNDVSLDFRPGNQPLTLDQPVNNGSDSKPSTQQNQFISLPSPDEIAQQVQAAANTILPPANDNRAETFQSDTAVVPAGAMTNVLPRENVTNPIRGSETTTRLPLEQSWSRVDSLVQSGQLQSALADLTGYYRQSDLPPNQRQRLLEWLDALAAKVIYSPEHNLRSLPYIIQPGDTIASLARDWQVPAQLIYNVNTDRIPDPTNLPSGAEIKIIQGPFDAEIDSAGSVMTLFLNNMYAGRFSIGSKSVLNSGEFRIIDKSAADKTGRPYWIELNNGVAIYGSDQGAIEGNEIALNPSEAEELFSILSATSNIRVIR